MRIEPEIIIQRDGNVKLYKCKLCNLKFTPMDMLSNKRIKGVLRYCPRCKTKFSKM